MNCDRSKALVSVYVDGELSEELAGPLRRHLMECAECRASVSEAKAMASWFVPSAPISVPEGFAARVARLALRDASEGAVSGAGAHAASAPARRGSGPAPWVPAPSEEWLAPTRAIQDAPQGPRAQGLHALGRPAGVDRTARFAMSLAAVAATVLIGLTLLLASEDRKGFDGAIQATPPVDNVLDALEELNRRENVEAPAPAPAPEADALREGTEQPPSPR